MKYSDTTNLNGVIQTIEDLTNLGQTTISGNTALLKQFTSYINQEDRRIWATIFNVSGAWQFDDANQTDIPEAYTDLVSAQAKYSLPTDALTIQRVEAKDSNGNWFVVEPITKEMTNEALDEFYDTAGQPVYYRLYGSSLELSPAPNYNSTGGLKIYYDRDVFDFTTSDTTKTPGFASPYHLLLPIKVAILWLTMKQPTTPSLQGLRLEEAKLEADLKDFYSKRFKDKPKRIGRKKENFN